MGMMQCLRLTHPELDFWIDGATTSSRMSAGNAPALPQLVVAHWPHVGSSYGGFAAVGQGLHGWMDDFDRRA
jgi:hypothetical protein